MNTKHARKWSLMTMLVFTVAVTVASNATAADPPNILMISIDDLNANVGYLGGNPGSKTPALDLVAANSTRYMDAHTSSPVCVASRASLLWGVKPTTTGITTGWIAANQRYQQFKNTTNLKNIVQLLAENGYHTMGSGKVFHDQDPDHFDETFQQPHLPNPFLQHGASDPDVVQPDEKIANWAIDKLKQQHDKPFLLAVGLHLPHYPMLAPQQYLDQHPMTNVTLHPSHPDDLTDVGPIAIAQANAPFIFDTPYFDIVSTEELRSQTRSYQACVSHTDHQILRLIGTLIYSAHRNNTVVIIWSDHGFHLGEKRHIGKATLWNESTHVPLLIHAPDFIPIETVDHPVSLLDLAPTIADIAGVPRPAHFEGQSLVGFNGQRPEPVATYYGNSVSYVNANLRLTLHNDDNDTLQEVEVYNRQTDPHELNNLAAGWTP